MKRFITIHLLILLIIVLSRPSGAVNTDSLQQVLATAEGDHRLEVLNTLSWELKFGDPQQGRKYAMEAMALAEKQQDDNALMLAYRNLGGIMYVQGRTDSSLYYAQLARKFAQRLGNKYQLGKALNLIAVNYENINDFNKAMEFQDMALKIFLELGDSAEIHGNLHNKAVLYESVNDYISAYQLYKKILDYEIRKKNDLGICRTALQIGTIAERNEDYYNARKYYNLTIEYADKINNMRWKSAALNDIAGIYQDQDSFDMALNLYRQALKINREHGFADYEANNLTNMADIYSYSDKEKAIEYYKKADALYVAKGDLISTSRIKLSLAGLLAGQGMLDTAEILSRKALTLADSLKFPGIMRSANFELYEIFKQKGQTIKALEHLEEYIRWRNTLESSEEEEKLTKLQARYDFQKVEKEKSELKAENNLQVLKNKQQQIIMLVMIGLGILLIIFVVIMIVGRRRLKALNAELDRKNIQVQKQADMLEQALVTKDKFFSIVAHDLKNPFMGIMGFAELLKEKTEEDEDEELHAFASSIYKSSNNLFELLENLLSWAKSQRGDFQIHNAELNLHEETKKVVDQLQWNADSKKLDIDHNIGKSITVYSDKNVLHTVSRNLLNNAIKYSHPGSKIELGTIDKESEVIVFFKDFGIGISEQMQASLFKIDDTKVVPGTGKETGTGLGLVLCKELIDRQGGQIWLESKTGEGSTIYFSLPKNK